MPGHVFSDLVGPGACAVRAFLPGAKISAQGGLTAQPLAALPPYGCGVPLAGVPPGALGCCKDIALCKKAKSLFLFDRTEDFSTRTHRAHCAATAKREIQRNKSAAVHPLYTRAIDAQQKNTLRTAHLPSPAPARSAVKRTGSVTTERQAAPCSTKLRSKIETKL